MNIAQLRQMGHRVIDVFPFCNEFELLELRLTMLEPYVDYFVLVECPQTFSGNEKPLFFTENSMKFDRWKDKLIVHVVSDPIKNRRDLRSRLSDEDITDLDKWILKDAATSPLTRGAFHWKQEFYQKESARKAIPKLDDEDLVFYGDLDEIWNPKMTFNWDINTIFKLEQTVFQYWMNNRSNDRWNSAFFTAAKNIQNRSLNVIRSLQVDENIANVESGGWHFTFQGGIDRIKYKIESYGHQEFNKKRLKSKIGTQISLNRDLFNRKINFSKDESLLPSEALAMKKNLPNWFL